MQRVLIVEDETDLADLIGYNLRRAGYEVETVSDGAHALRRVQEALPDAIVLDLMLPGLSGLQIARQIRTDTRTALIPILMLTARVEEADQVGGLQAGADDYVTKPFSMKVLVARVEALLRRSRAGASTEASGELALGPIRLSTATHSATVDGREIKLTLTEFRLLGALLRKPGRVVSRADLMYAAMGPDVLVTARTIDVHVASIRKKMGGAGGMIRTIRGVGYVISADGEGAAGDESHDDAADDAGVGSPVPPARG